MDLGGCSQESVDDWERVRDVESPPFICDLSRDRQDAVGIGGVGPLQPSIELVGLSGITTSEPLDP